MIKKKCSKCGKRIEKEFDFCPHCGHNLKKEKEKKDYGLLGRKDSLSSGNDFIGGLGLPNGFNKIFNNLMQQIDREFRSLDQKVGEERKRKKKPKSRGISINISTGTGKKPEIKVRGHGPGFSKKRKGKKIKKKSKKKVKKPNISEKKAKKMADLPREEAEAQVRRLSDKLIYEVEMPDVEDIDNIAINKLENSIEIKAFAEDKVYFKLLPVSLDILDYNLKNGKLILELKQE